MDDAAQTEAVFVYMTMSSIEEAERIGRALVGEGLAACVNLLPGMRSIYRWRETIEEAGEVVCIAKTVAARFEALRLRVRELHAYETPCIVMLRLEAGDAGFLGWIADSVK